MYSACSVQDSATKVYKGNFNAWSYRACSVQRTVLSKCTKVILMLGLLIPNFTKEMVLIKYTVRLMITNKF